MRDITLPDQSWVLDEDLDVSDESAEEPYSFSYARI